MYSVTVINEYNVLKHAIFGQEHNTYLSIPTADHGCERLVKSVLQATK